ncbi:hypothetical protein ACHWQZ_G016551 [Mnemiopsis leidyi]
MAVIYKNVIDYINFTVVPAEALDCQRIYKLSAYYSYKQYELDTISLDANSDQIAVSVEPKLEDNDYLGDESPGEIKTEGHGKRDPTIGLFFKRDQETWLGNMKMKSRKKPDYKRKDHRRNTDEAKIKKRIISHEPDSTS